MKDVGPVENQKLNKEVCRNPTLQNGLGYSLTMFWSPQLHSFCVHDT